jgi:hypothetical protein
MSHPGSMPSCFAEVDAPLLTPPSGLLAYLFNLRFALILHNRSQGCKGRSALSHLFVSVYRMPWNIPAGGIDPLRVVPLPELRKWRPCCCEEALPRFRYHGWVKQGRFRRSFARRTNSDRKKGDPLTRQSEGNRWRKRRGDTIVGIIRCGIRCRSTEPQ